MFVMLAKKKDLEEERKKKHKGSNCEMKEDKALCELKY